MKQSEINRILSRGSIKNKTLLMMSHYAHSNTALGIFAIDSNPDPISKPILTDDQVADINRAIYRDKDIFYLETLKKRNNSVIIFIPQIISHYETTVGTSIALREATLGVLKVDILAHTINDIIGLLPLNDQVKAKEIALNPAQLTTEKHTSEKLFSPQLNLFGNVEYRNKDRTEQIIQYVNKINDNNFAFKSLVAVLAEFVKQEIPIFPYSDWLNRIEHSNKEAIDHDKINNALNIIGINERIMPYEKITVAIDPEEINDIKLAGL